VALVTFYRRLLAITCITGLLLDPAWAFQSRELCPAYRLDHISILLRQEALLLPQPLAGKITLLRQSNLKARVDRLFNPLRHIVSPALLSYAVVPHSGPNPIEVKSIGVVLFTAGLFPLLSVNVFRQIARWAEKTPKIQSGVAASIVAASIFIDQIAKVLVRAYIPLQALIQGQGGVKIYPKVFWAVDEFIGITHVSHARDLKHLLYLVGFAAASTFLMMKYKMKFQEWSLLARRGILLVTIGFWFTALDHLVWGRVTDWLAIGGAGFTQPVYVHLIDFYIYPGLFLLVMGLSDLIKQHWDDEGRTYLKWLGKVYIWGSSLGARVFLFYPLIMFGAFPFMVFLGVSAAVLFIQTENGSTTLPPWILKILPKLPGLKSHLSSINLSLLSA
jgi:lipoprotein signal peptidase